MAKIDATDKPLYWSAVSGGAIVHSGITPVGNTTVSNDLISNDDPNTYLGSVLSAGVDVSEFTPLPAFGEQVEANSIYAYNGELVIARQTHRRTEHAPADIPNLFLTYRENAGDVLEWIPNESILLGMQRTYNDITYVCIQPHTTVEGQTPDITQALWNAVASSSEWQAGVEYFVDDVVTYQGNEYRCIQRHTAIVGWQPPNVGIINVLWVAV